MSRGICICLEFLTPAHKRRIQEVAKPLGFTPYFFGTDQLEEARERLQGCEILYAHSKDLARSAPAGLKWYCCSWAGVEPYCEDPTILKNPRFLLTNSNGYGVTIAEHILMTALMLLRRYPEYQRLIQNREWSNRLRFRAMRDTRFTILGTGGIGAVTARRLRAMEAREITGLSRSGKSRPEFDRVLPISRLDEELVRAEFLIMALPSTPETRGLLSATRLALLPRGAYLINVGRGDALDQAALVEALRDGRLAGAALDVASPEPLPADDPLWEAPNLILTPHVAGNMIPGYTSDINVEMFCADLENYALGRPLARQVDRGLGY